MTRDKQADLARLKDIFDQLPDNRIERILSFAGTQLKEEFASATDASSEALSITASPQFIESLNVRALKDVPSQAMAIWRMVESVRQREARAQLSEDELTTRRARDSERQREHRAQLSGDALVERRAREADRKRQSRARQLTKD